MFLDHFDPKCTTYLDRYMYRTLIFGGRNSSRSTLRYAISGIEHLYQVRPSNNISHTHPREATGYRYLGRYRETILTGTVRSARLGLGTAAQIRKKPLQIIYWMAESLLLQIFNRTCLFHTVFTDSSENLRVNRQDTVYSLLARLSFWIDFVVQDWRSTQQRWRYNIVGDEKRFKYPSSKYPNSLQCPNEPTAPYPSILAPCKLSIS